MAKKKAKKTLQGPLVDWFIQNKKALAVFFGVLIVLFIALSLPYSPAKKPLLGNTCGTVSPDSRDKCCVEKRQGDRYNIVKGACVTFEEEMNLLAGDLCISKASTDRVYRCWDYVAYFNSTTFSTKYYRFDSSNFTCAGENPIEECKKLSSGSNCKKVCY